MAMLYVTTFQKMLWPLSWYPMFATVQTAQKSSGRVSYELYELSSEGRERPLADADRFFWRDVRVAVLYGLLQRQNAEARCSELLSSILNAYTRYRGNFGFAPKDLKALKLYLRSLDAPPTLICESKHVSG